jgi:hypothetical protein
MMKRWLVGFVGLVVLFAAVAPVNAAIRSGFNSSYLSANDDGSTGLLNIGFTLDLWGSTYSQLYANNNGNVTFDGSLYTYTPFDLNSTGTKIIAAFFGDVDTRGYGSDLLRYGTGDVGGRNAFGVTWDGVGVGYYSAHVDKLNCFQLLLIDRSDTGPGNFDIEFNYDQIQWETGDASSGSGGLGGYPARVGYSNGAGTSYELPGSGVSGSFLDSNTTTGLKYNSNCNVDGRLLFTARNGEVHPVVPEPATFIIWSLLGVLGVAAGSWRRRKAG